MALFALAPIDGAYVVYVLPASLLAALGMALAYIPATIAGMAGARPEETGLASGLINTSYQIGSALGLAAMTALAAGQTEVLLAEGGAQIIALNGGFHAAFLGAAVIAIAAGALALVAIRTPQQAPRTEPVSGIAS
jgi:hypothetical protein